PSPPDWPVLRRAPPEPELARDRQPTPIPPRSSHVNVAARGPHDLRGQQAHRTGPDDQHLVTAAYHRLRLQQRGTHAGERLPQPRPAPVQPIRKPMQVPDRNEQARSERAVGMRADRTSLGAEVDAPGQTINTPPARREIRLAGNARPEPRLIHPCTDLRYHAGDLVTHRHRLDGLGTPGGDVEIGAADPSSEPLHHHLARPNDRLRPLGEGDIPCAGRELREADPSAPETRA